MHSRRIGNRRLRNNCSRYSNHRNRHLRSNHRTHSRHLHNNLRQPSNRGTHNRQHRGSHRKRHRRFKQLWHAPRHTGLPAPSSASRTKRSGISSPVGPTPTARSRSDPRTPICRFPCIGRAEGSSAANLTTTVICRLLPGSPMQTPLRQFPDGREARGNGSARTTTASRPRTQ